MRIIIDINTDNDSMTSEADYRYEIERLMGKVTSAVINGQDYRRLLDINGNCVGSCTGIGIPDFEEAKE